MEIVTVQSEQIFGELLQQIKQSPEDWLSIHINTLSLQNQIISQSGLSTQALTKIHKISAELAKNLASSELNRLEGKIFIFEDGDMFALCRKNPSLSINDILQSLKREFIKNGMEELLIIEEMKDRLTQLIVSAEERAHVIADYRLRMRAVEIGENLDKFTEVDPQLTRAIMSKRRSRLSGCVLIIEDDAMVRGLICAMLKDDYVVVQAKNATAGVIAYIDCAPDVVLLDIHLGEANGHDTLKHIIRIDPSAYVVMLSGDSSSENVLSAHEKGAVGFVKKPFSKVKLQEYFNKCPHMQSKPKK